MDIVYSCPPTKASLSRYRSILSKIEKYRQEALERSQREMQATVRLCKKFWIWFSYLGKHAKVWVSWPHVSAARWIAIHEPSSRGWGHSFTRTWYRKTWCQAGFRRRNWSHLKWTARFLSYVPIDKYITKYSNFGIARQVIVCTSRKIISSLRIKSSDRFQVYHRASGLSNAFLLSFDLNTNP